MATIYPGGNDEFIDPCIGEIKQEKMNKIKIGIRVRHSTQIINHAKERIIQGDDPDEVLSWAKEEAVKNLVIRYVRHSSNENNETGGISEEDDKRGDRRQDIGEKDDHNS